MLPIKFETCQNHASILHKTPTGQDKWLTSFTVNLKYLIFLHNIYKEGWDQDDKSKKQMAKCYQVLVFLRKTVVRLGKQHPLLRVRASYIKPSSLWLFIIINLLPIILLFLHWKCHLLQNFLLHKKAITALLNHMQLELITMFCHQTVQPMHCCRSHASTSIPNQRKRQNQQLLLACFIF